MSDFTIGRLSERTGVHIETIRYYEKIGLIPKPLRSEGGRRLYDAGAAQRLSFVRRARDLGFSLEDVRSLLGLADEKVICAEAFDIAERHRLNVRSRIVDLRRLERRLHSMTQACSRGETPDCAILDVLGGEWNSPSDA